MLGWLKGGYPFYGLGSFGPTLCPLAGPRHWSLVPPGYQTLLVPSRHCFFYQVPSPSWAQTLCLWASGLSLLLVPLPLSGPGGTFIPPLQSLPQPPSFSSPALSGHCLCPQADLFQDLPCHAGAALFTSWPLGSLALLSLPCLSRLEDHLLLFPDLSVPRLGLFLASVLLSPAQ